MIRIIIDGLLIFLIPFAVYAMYRAFAERDPRAAFRITHGPLIVLTIVGLILCIGAITMAEFSAPRGTGGYTPARWENGKLIEGMVKP